MEKYWLDRLSDGNISAIYDLPMADASVSNGSCGNETDSISIDWLDKNHTGHLKLAFAFDQSEQNYSLNEITMNFPAAILGINSNKSIELFYHGDQLTSAIGQSYCSETKQSLALTNEHQNRSMGTLDLFDLCFKAHSVPETHPPEYNAFAVGM